MFLTSFPCLRLSSQSTLHSCQALPLHPTIFSYILWKIKQSERVKKKEKEKNGQIDLTLTLLAFLAQDALIDWTLQPARTQFLVTIYICTFIEWTLTTWVQKHHPFHSDVSYSTKHKLLNIVLRYDAMVAHSG